MKEGVVGAFREAGGGIPVLLNPVVQVKTPWYFHLNKANGPGASVVPGIPWLCGFFLPPFIFFPCEESMRARNSFARPSTLCAIFCPLLFFSALIFNGDQRENGTAKSVNLGQRRASRFNAEGKSCPRQIPSHGTQKCLSDGRVRLGVAVWRA